MVLGFALTAFRLTVHEACIHLLPTFVCWKVPPKNKIAQNKKKQRKTPVQSRVPTWAPTVVPVKPQNAPIIPKNTKKWQAFG